MEEASKSPTTVVNGDDEQSEEDEDEDRPCDPKIYTVKVIDFAHAEWTPGMGPDENSLLGVRSVSRYSQEIRLTLLRASHQFGVFMGISMDCMFTMC